MLARPVVALVSLLAVAAACGGPELEFADWVEPVPRPGVAVHEYAAVPYEERSEHIEAVDDLVLGDALDPEQAFYQPSGVVADAAGNIIVLDRGDHRIQMFDAQGNYLRTLGREGQGPGELANPSSLTISSQYVTLRADTRRLSIWTVAGEHVRDVMLTESLLTMMGFDGGFVARSSFRPESESPTERANRILTLASYDPFGERLEAFVDIEEPPPIQLRMSGGGGVVVSMSGGLISEWAFRPAVGRDGSVYLTTSTEYQVHAYGPRAWSLRVAWPRAAVTQEHIDNTSMSFTSSGPFEELDLSSVKWPDHFAAISGIEVDGHGHLYVFPFHLPLHAPRAEGEERPDIPRPVDVYSPGGELLFTGLIDISGWTSARGDFVYSPRANETTDETEVVRYRLVEPF